MEKANQLIRLLVAGCACSPSRCTRESRAQTVNAAQVQQAILSSPGMPARTFISMLLRFGNLATFLRVVSTVYNGSCCYGVPQMEQSNIASIVPPALPGAVSHWLTAATG